MLILAIFYFLGTAKRQTHSDMGTQNLESLIEIVGLPKAKSLIWKRVASLFMIVEGGF